MIKSRLESRLGGHGTQNYVQRYSLCCASLHTDCTVCTRTYLLLKEHVLYRRTGKTWCILRMHQFGAAGGILTQNLVLQI